MVNPGSVAPDFTLPDQDGNKVSLGLRGRTVVLVFYPADFSPVCTDQMNVYQEVLPQIEEQGATLVGISVDGPSPARLSGSTSAFSMPLLADFHPKGEVAKAYGVFVEDYGVAGRALVMVDPGVVKWAYRSPPLEIPGANLIFDALEQRATA